MAKRKGQEGLLCRDLAVTNTSLLSSSPLSSRLVPYRRRYQRNPGDTLL